MTTLKAIAYVIGIALLLFVIASVFDIFIAVWKGRFYTSVTFIVLFGVAGVFASVFGYIKGIELFQVKDEKARWTLLLTEIGVGAIFWFLLSPLEGGDYAPVMKSFGLMLGMTSFIFLYGKPGF
ncbi:MAG: hypothetical protein IPQ08_04060 [Chitinophagaceae bacterium]|nr:hypothetical protein [Chitinophagaceae bacterium]